MFCEDPIQAVYTRFVELAEDNAYLDCFNDLAYHIAGDFAVVMLTEHDYLKFDRNGAIKTPITDELLEQLRDEYDPCVHKCENEPPFIYYEHVLFCGERINSVEHLKDKRETIVHFEDFDFRFVVHDSEFEFPSHLRDHFSYYLTRGCERHLKRRCPMCGGEGEVLLDFVADYMVRCRSCKRATWAQISVQDAIDEWNGGYLHCAVADEKIANLNS